MTSKQPAREYISQQEHVLALYKQLDTYRQLRRRLARGWLLWVMGLILVILVSIPLANAALLPVAVMWGLLGLWALWLGWRTHATGLEGRALESEVEALKRQQIAAAFSDEVDTGGTLQKPARDEEVFYTLGADGELVEVEDPFFDEDVDVTARDARDGHHGQRRRS